MTEIDRNNFAYNLLELIKIIDLLDLELRITEEKAPDVKYYYETSPEGKGLIRTEACERHHFLFSDKIDEYLIRGGNLFRFLHDYIFRYSPDHILDSDLDRPRELLLPFLNGG